MQFQIRHLFYATITNAIIFALICWFGTGKVIAFGMIVLISCFLGMPIAILVVAVPMIRRVNKQLDDRSSKILAMCVSIWLMSSVMLFFIGSVIALWR